MFDNQKDLIGKFLRKREFYTWFLWKPEHDVIRKKRSALRRNLKWCIIAYGGKLDRAMIDMKTNIIYKVDGYKETWIRYTKGVTFVRYMNMMEF